MMPASRGWRPSVVSWVSVSAALIGFAVFLYPEAASWTSAVNQSQVIQQYSAEVRSAEPSPVEQLTQAQQYNAALSAGVDLDGNASVPTSVGSSASGLDYDRMLAVDASGMMARIRIPSIEVDLPIYHGTSDATLLRGAGHLEGSHLPVGGAGTHAVITAHRGLADATMFSDLDRVEVGDRFTVETLGEVLTYEVIETRVVAPEDTDSLRAGSDADLVTLVTCTPLGINTHRILVTGTRVTPTPAADLAAVGSASDLPGFAWWAVAGAGALSAATLALWRLGIADAAAPARRSR